MVKRRGNSWQATFQGVRRSFKEKRLADKYERSGITSGVLEAATLASFYSHHATAIWPDAHPKNTDSNQRAIERLLGATTPLTEITTPVMTRAVAELRQQGKKPSTINTRLSHLKGLLSYAMDLEALQVMPKIPWAKRKDNGRLKFLSEMEEYRINRRLKLHGFGYPHLFKFLIDTGLRPGELLQGDTKGKPLDRENVSTDAGGTLPATGLGPFILINDTKTDGARVVPLTKTATRIMKLWLDKSGRYPSLQSYFYANRLNVINLSRAVSECAKEVGIEDVVLYTARHTCASRLVQRGADLTHIRDWMGHKDIKTTLRYAKLAPKNLFEIKELLE